MYQGKVTGAIPRWHVRLLGRVEGWVVARWCSLGSGEQSTSDGVGGGKSGAYGMGGGGSSAGAAASAL